MTLPSTARPAWCEIDLDALAHNTRAIRELIGPDVRFYAVCKNDAYGSGARESARTMLASGADAFAVSDPEDAARIRAAGIAAPILLYASTTPDQADAVADLDLIVTVHDHDGLEAWQRAHRKVKVHVEVDCGYGRLGFTPGDWPALFERLSHARNLDVIGLYTHLASVEVPHSVKQQAALFQQAIDIAHQAGFTDIETMAASSRVLLGYPELNLTAVNPGRMLYGMMERPWLEGPQFQPVIRAIKSRVLQVKTIPADFPIDDARHRANPGSMRVAIIAFGFKDGLPRQPGGGTVLVNGARARIVGVRSTEHTVIDVTYLPGVVAGDEVVIVGRQGSQSIDAHEAVTMYGSAMIELLPRMSLNLPRLYFGGAATTSADASPGGGREAAHERTQPVAARVV